MPNNRCVRASFGDDQETVLLIDRPHEHILSSPTLILDIGELPTHRQTPGQRVLRRGRRYGTLICDLERRRIVDILPDREPATVET